MFFPKYPTKVPFLLLLLLSSCAADYYKILGIKKSATPKEIKKAYRSKSLQYHPDKNQEEGASDKFAEISRAYEVLTDDTLKGIYDSQGEAGLERHEKGGGGGGGGNGFEDIFNHFGFGGGMGGGRQREQKSGNIEMKLRLTLKQLYMGATIDVEYERQGLCMHWQDCMKNAQECQGPGVKVRMQQIAPGFVQQVQQKDDTCIARGKRWRPNCRSCPDGQTQPEKLNLTIDVTKGQRAGEKIVFEGASDEKPGMPAGDLVFTIIEIKDEKFRREGDHLYMNMEIPLVDALTGFKRDITHLDGSKFTIEVDGVTECDHTMRVPRKGMGRRANRGYGDLFITFEVDFPLKFDIETKQQLRQILEPVTSNEYKQEL